MEGFKIVVALLEEDLGFLGWDGVLPTELVSVGPLALAFED
jgi:hypothetical protein